jgi:hypothetical protein
LFATGSEQPGQEFGTVAETIVRTARYCRMGGVTVTLDDSDADLAHRRAQALVAILGRYHWPEDRVAIVYVRKRALMSIAEFGFRDPDPGWRPPMENPPRACAQGVCRTAPWPPARLYLSAPGYLGPHAGMVFFTLGSAHPDADGQSVVVEDARTMKSDNYRTILLVGNADASEPDTMTLSRERAEAVRTTLISQGVAADSISVRANGADTPLVAPGTKDFDPRFNARVTVELGD